jgi:hypothetical protein
MNQIAIVIFVVIILGVLLCGGKNEGFYFRSPSLSYDAEACGRQCDNTSGCNSYYFDPSSRQCWKNSAYSYSDLYYPYVNNTYWFSPSRYKFGRYFGDIQGKYRPDIIKEHKKR